MFIVLSSVYAQLIKLYGISHSKPPKIKIAIAAGVGALVAERNNIRAPPHYYKSNFLRRVCA